MPPAFIMRNARAASLAAVVSRQYSLAKLSVPRDCALTFPQHPLCPLMQKLHPRYGRIIVPALLTFFMTAIVSGISTLVAVGPSLLALKIWSSAWPASWFVAFPAASFMLPFSQWLASFVVQQPK